MTPATEDQPLYLRIADALRQQIADGELAEGTRIPSEVKLAETWGTTRPTVRQALDVLLTEGLITKQATRGTFVRRRPAITVRSSTRYQRRPAGETSPFARDAQREGAAPDWVWDTQRTRAEGRIADRLGLAVGEHVMKTRYLFRADGRPVQASVSWEPFALVGGTDIEEPEGTDGVTGVIARMDTIGVHVDRVTELVRARPADDDERRELDVPDGVWVMTIERTHWAGGRAVETADITIPADRYALAYEIPV
ncbi:GntR family transcriptional regulator [Candidatus Protofrankia californiensis]|uniref:GntR family transcriptional regulator n=1 Tax=Candidatus Protofrankia californiensis TaxID=1839754 RepID=UPI0010417A60|nr:GntR family transcriptional regulator [Candidatus Protofrankia californiensis]